MNDLEFDRCISGLHRFREKTGNGSGTASSDVAQGRIAQTLAASKPGGSMLCVNAPELSFWLLGGMDISSKLICLAGDDTTFVALSESHDDDIRLTVHRQHAIAFFGDVRDHRFDLMVFREMEPGLAELATSTLAPGGLLVILPVPGIAPELKAQEESVLAEHGLLTGTSGDLAIFAARPPDTALRKRRTIRNRHSR